MSPPRIGVHFEVVVYRLVSVCILQYRLVSSCIASYRCVFCSIDLTAGGAGSLHSRENPHRENPHVFTCIVSVSSAHQKQGIDMYRRVSGTVSIDCFDLYRACIECASGTVTYRYVSGMYRKGQIGRVENGHVFTRIERVKFCVLRTRLYCHVSVMY